jgi:UDP-N-acetyl-D-mannosaminuronic acid dehydrogenase
VLAGLRDDYPRASALPGPGFAAGPCLFKDTLQLAAFMNNTFGLGYAAIQVNEGLPAFVVDQIAARYRINEMTVGILGMAFKANSDDTRSSLSYKLKKLLMYKARAVLTTDPLVNTDRELLPVAEVVERSDVLIVGAPHREYKHLDLRGKPLFDIWNFVAPPS